MPPKASLENHKKIYQSLCYVLSDRASQIAWDEYTLADWELFSQMADREGVAPLMYWKLKDSPVAVPPSTFNLLRSTYYQTLAQNTLMYQELERILKALDEAGIPVIVLKGAALAATVYEDIGLRPMGDLDLLVKEDVFQDALSVMLSIGYWKEPLPSYELNQLIGRNIHLHSKLHSAVKVELHWRLSGGKDSEFVPDEDSIWERSEPLVKFGKESPSGEFSQVFVFKPEPHIVYLSAHLLILHSSAQRILLWFFDIYRLIQCYYNNLDWDDITLLLQSNSRETVLRIALEESLNRFDSPLISEVVEKVKSNKRLPELAISTNSFFNEDSSKLAQIMNLFDKLDYGARFYFIVSKILPNPEYMKWKYAPRNGVLLPLLYIQRLFALLRFFLLELLKSRKKYRRAIQKQK